MMPENPKLKERIGHDVEELETKEGIESEHDTGEPKTKEGIESRHDAREPETKKGIKCVQRRKEWAMPQSKASISC